MLTKADVDTATHVFLILENVFQMLLLLHLPARTEGYSEVQGKKQRRCSKSNFISSVPSPVKICARAIKVITSFSFSFPPVLNFPGPTAFNSFVFILFSNLVKILLLLLQFFKAFALTCSIVRLALGASYLVFRDF